MFKKFLKFIPLIGILFLFGCAAQSHFQVVNNSTSGKLFSPTVLLLPLNNTLIPYNTQQELMQGSKDDESFCLINEKQIFNDFMAPTFADNTFSKVIPGNSSFDVSQINFSYTKLYSDNKKASFHMFVPQKGKIQIDDKKPKYVIFFEDLNFNKEFTAEGGGLGKTSQRVVIVKSSVKYCIWDNTNEEIVAYGKLAKNLRLLSLPKRTEYLEVFDEYAKKIISASPFTQKLN